MNDEQRAAVYDSARYLREVRPLDPEEIHEYVPGQPHPAAVREVLRDVAVGLNLIERGDGTFTPAGTEPIQLEFDGVDALPERWVDAVAEAVLEQYGAGWPGSDAGDDLRDCIRGFKEQYLAGAHVDYDRETALGYTIYHLPAYYAAIQYPLADLLHADVLSPPLRILDVGAGVGGPALGLHDLVPAEVPVDYHAVEPSDAAADLLEAFLSESGRNFRPTVHRRQIQQFDPLAVLAAGPAVEAYSETPPEETSSDEISSDEISSDETAHETISPEDDSGFDLVVFANVLSELPDAGQALATSLEWLAPDGTVLALEPADRNTATGLRTAERTAERRGGATVYAPTVRLWPGERPTGECWSFEDAGTIAVPGFQRRLDEAGGASGEFLNADVQYAYSVLRRDDLERIGFRPDPTAFAKMAAMNQHVTERIDCVGIKLSPDLAARSGPGWPQDRRTGAGGDRTKSDNTREDANPVFLVGDGSEDIDHFAVLTEESVLNRDLSGADYGALLRFENVLVLWNDDEEAYNLVVDGETGVYTAEVQRA